MTNMSTSENLSDVRPKTNGSVASALRRFQNVMKNSSSPTKKKKIVTAFDRLTRSEENNQGRKIRAFSTLDDSVSTKNTLESKNQGKKDDKNLNQNQKRHKDEDQDQERDKDMNQEHDGNEYQDQDQERDKDMNQEHDGNEYQDQDRNPNGSEDEDVDENEDGSEGENQNNSQETGSGELFADNPLFKAISQVDTNNNTIKSLLDGKITETTSLIPLLSGTITRTNSFSNYGSPNHYEINAEFHDIEMVLPYDANININTINRVSRQKWIIWMVVVIMTILCVVAVYLYLAL